jgi:spore coat protein U-like protein
VKRFVSVAAILVSLFLVRGAESACNVTATGVNFGPYDAASYVPGDSTGSVTVSCDRNPPTDVTVTIGPSGNSGAFNPRSMRQTTRTDRLNYNLYTDASRNVVWGDGTAGTAAVTLRKVNRNRPVTATIYARTPSGQDVTPGIYVDTLVVTILY